LRVGGGKGEGRGEGEGEGVGKGQGEGEGAHNKFYETKKYKAATVDFRS